MDSISSDSSFRYLLEVAYDGTDFCGWQVQPNGTSVQQVLEFNLSRIYADMRIDTESSGRTDAGVHALAQAVTFTPPLRPLIDQDKLFRSLNRMLPRTIRIVSIRKVPRDFHARFSALAKTYTYVINTGPSTPFVERWSWNLRSFTKIREVRAAMKMLEGVHDFSAFTVDRKEIGDAVRTLFSAKLKRFGPIICLTFTGDGFLYKMIRSIVGTIAFVGEGRIPPEETGRILESRDRSEAYDTAPAQGLFLMKVYYRKGEWRRFRLERPPFHC